MSTLRTRGDNMRHLTRSAVFLFFTKGKKVLLQKRMNTGFMDGYYDATVSGHIEANESITQAALRETREEIGLEIPSSALNFYTTLHTHFDEHDYFYFYFQVDIEKLPHFDIRNGEPEKIEEFKWFSLSKLPKKISEFNIVALENYETGNPLSELGWPFTPEKCSWAYHSQKMMDYHDHEWGVPCHDDQALFERLTLETMQAGLSWSTILNKRENFREAFSNFDIQTVATYDEAKVQSLLQNEGIIRNQLKIRAAIANANAILAIQEKYGSFDAFCWNFVDYKPVINEYTTMAEVPAFTPLAETFRKALLKEGVKFVGPTIVYSFMQSIGMVNDHLTTCPCK